MNYKKTIIVFVLCVVLPTISFAYNNREFSTSEIISLFGKDQKYIFNKLSNKGYSFKNKNLNHFNFYKKTSLCDFIVELSFKNGKLNAIKTNEPFQNASDVAMELNLCLFEVVTSSNGSNVIIPYSGCLYGLKNSKLGVVASFIINKDNPYIIIVSYSLDPNNMVEGDLSNKLKIEREKINKIVNDEFKKELETQQKMKIDANVPFKKLETINQPILLLKDTLGLQNFVLNCLFDESFKELIEYEFIFDSNGNVTDVFFKKPIFDYYGKYISMENTEFMMCSKAEIIQKFNSLFVINEPAKIFYKNKYLNVPYKLELRIQINSKYYLTNQTIYKKQSRKKSNLVIVKGNPTDPYEQHLLKKYPFLDNSYEEVITKYFLENPPIFKNTQNSLDYIIKKTDYSIQINYNIEMPNLLYSKTTWTIKPELEFMRTFKER